VVLRDKMLFMALHHVSVSDAYRGIQKEMLVVSSHQTPQKHP
jgi:hypothetical protein